MIFFLFWKNIAERKNKTDKTIIVITDPMSKTFPQKETGIFPETRADTKNNIGNANTAGMSADFGMTNSLSMNLPMTQERNDANTPKARKNPLLISDGIPKIGRMKIGNRAIVPKSMKNEIVSAKELFFRSFMK